MSVFPSLQTTPYTYTWNDTNIAAADDAGLERGEVPRRAPYTGMGSGNHQFDVPIINQDGRGIDINLELHYNSRVWTRINNLVYFDIDKDLYAGWSLGFGKIIVAGNTYVIFGPDGTRHSSTGTAYGNFPSPATSLQSFEGRTIDGTHIDYYAEGYKPAFNGGQILKAWARLPNGTTIDYGASESGAGKTGAIYPTQITDANGNFISITYRGNQGPQIETITDSLGRVIQCYYDSNNLLTAITAPGLNGGQPRVLVRLAYTTRNVRDAGQGQHYGFHPTFLTAIVRSDTFPAVRAIYYPATGTGFWFGDADSYSPYGMIRKVSERRGMTCSAGGGDCASPSAALTQQATIGAGTMSQEQTYTHPTSPGYSYPHIYGLLQDVPTFTQSTEDWAARDTASAPVTGYAMADNGLTRTLTITRPDGVRSVQTSNDDPSSDDYGTVTGDATYPDASSTTPLSRSTTTWGPGDGGTRVPTEVDIFDERGQKTYTTYSYGARDQIIDIRQYGYSGNLLRRTHSEYENGAAYIGSLINSGTLWYLGNGPQWSGPHIFNLVKATEIYAANDTTREARAEYSYDEFALQDTPGVTQHTTAPAQRGNLTSSKQYANAVTLDSATAVTETRNYDICGNAIKIISACCEQATFQFTLTTQYAWPEVTTRGSASDTTKQNTTSAVYDFNTGLVKESYDANGRRSNTDYLPNSLRPEREYAPTGAYSYHIYDDAGLVVYDFVYEAGKIEPDFASRSDKYLDGLGRVHGEITFGKNYAEDKADTKFDNLGRVWQQTRPYRSGDTLQWTVYEYDKLDRLTKITGADGSIVQRFFNESSYPSAATQGVPGQTVRTKDPWNRERWARFDDQSRLVEVVEPDPAGTGSVASNGLKTSYTYNTLGNLTLVQQGSQTRSFKYDSLSRLTHQKLAERDATLNDSGQQIGSGTWSDVFSYDTRSNLIQRVEARGVKTIINYNNDPLNRPQSLQYDKSGVPASLVGNIPDAPTVTYAYLTTNDKTRLQSVTVTGGMGSEIYNYDVEGRLSQASQTFTGRESYPLVTNYVWDTLDRAKEITYPAQYGITNNPRKKVEPFYDIASRLDSLKFDSVNFASDIVYNAASQTTSQAIGSQVSENYTYHAQTGLLTSQQVMQGTTPLLDLKYNYTQTNDVNNSGAKTGQLTSITDLKNQVRNRAFAYDTLGRLKQVKGGTNAFSTPDWTQSYAFDRYGNRTGVTKTGTAPNIPLDGLPILSYNTGSNRITTTGFEHDPAGNQTRAVVDASGTQQQYRYDAAGRLAQVLDSSGNVIATYNYGGSNERYKSDEAGMTTYYGWDAGQIIAEYQASGTSALQWQTNYVYLGGRLLATTDASGTRFQHQDQRGTRLVTDSANGEVVAEQLTLPFGTMQPNGALGGDNSFQHATKTNPSKKRFTSYDRSATTGLDYAVNRFYSSQQGRFTRTDPIGMGAASLGNPQTLNMYAYCINDSINIIDPDGLLFGFLKKLFRGIVKVVSTVAKIVRVAVLAATAAYAAITFNIPLLAKSTLALLFEIGPRSLRRVAGFARGIVGAISGGGLGSLRTPGTLPSDTSGGVSSFLQQQKPENRKFTTVKDAAVAALQAINLQSIEESIKEGENVEYVGVICRNANGTYTPTTPAKKTDDFKPTTGCPSTTEDGRRGKISGSYHTHGARKPGDPDSPFENFSGDDILQINEENVPAYVAAPTGKIREYDPRQGKANPYNRKSVKSAGVFLKERAPAQKQ